VRLLLDTQAYLWWRIAPDKLTSHTRQAIEDAGDVAVSAVSGLEIAIKQSVGKLADEPALLDDPTEHDLGSVPVTWAHVQELRLLPLLHRDPFDRLLVAQARVERRTLVTSDPKVRAYDVATMPA